MFGDSKDSERLRNLAVFHVWMTDDEMAEVAPYVGVALLVMLFIGILVYICGGCDSKDHKKEIKKFESETMEEI